MKTKYYNLNNELKLELNKAYQFLEEDKLDQARSILKEVLKEYPPSKVLERKISACKNILKTLEFNTGKNLPYIDNKGRQIFIDGHRIVILSKPLSYFKVSKDADEKIYKLYSKYEDNFYNEKPHDIKYDDITDIIPSIKRLRKDVNYYRLSFNNANAKKYYLPNGICVNEISLLSMMEIITNPKVYWDKCRNHPLYFINNNDMGVLLPIISVPEHQNIYRH